MNQCPIRHAISEAVADEMRTELTAVPISTRGRKVSDTNKVNRSQWQCIWQDYRSGRLGIAR